MRTGRPKESGQPLTQQRLRKLIDYDPATGEFRWLRDRGGKAKAGTTAGGFRERGTARTDRGRLHIDVDGKRYPAATLAWLYVYGVKPSKLLDHINCDTRDNRISNLREASESENKCNTPRSKANTTGKKGTYWHKGARKFAAAISPNGKKIHLGFFSSLDDAHAAYCRAARKHFGEFARFE